MAVWVQGVQEPTEVGTQKKILIDIRKISIKGNRSWGDCNASELLLRLTSDNSIPFVRHEEIELMTK